MKKPSLIRRYLLFMLYVIPAAGPVHTLAQAPSIVWQRCYGGDSTDVINCIRQSPDGGYIAVGTTRSINGDLASNGGVKGLWVLKLDQTGNIEWEKTYASLPYGSSYIDIAQDSGYIVSGYPTVKLKKDGSIAWSVNLASNRVHPTSDGGYILCDNLGVSSLAKLNAAGGIVWQRPVDSASTYNLIVNDVCESYSSGYIITGSIYDIFHSRFVGKTDDLGNIVLPITDDYAHGVDYFLCRGNDGSYYVSGYENGRNAIARIDDNCTTEWDIALNAIGYLQLGGISATNSHGVLVTGGDTTHADLGIAAYDHAGNFLWSKGAGGSQSDFGQYGIQAANGNYVAAGYTFSNDGDVSGNHGGQDGWVVVFGTSEGVSQVATTPGIVVYPTPAAGQVFVELPAGDENAVLKLMDVSGKTMPVKEDNGSLTRTLYLDALPAGIYLLQITANGSSTNRKIVHY